MRNDARVCVVAVVASLTTLPCLAQSKQPAEIKLGQTMPYTGPLSAWGQIGKAFNTYLDKVNADGGINGRKIDMISLDDGYSPPKTFEQTRRLVERDGVIAMAGSLGTAPQAAVQKYLNAKKVPQLFVISGASRWADPKNYPWTIGLTPSYETEGRIYAHYVLASVPNAKAAILYQNDDLGREYLKGFKDGFGDRAASILVAEQSYDVTDPVVDSQVISLKSSGANVFFIAAGAKYTSQALRKAYDIGWQPIRFIIQPSSSIASVLEPAGAEKANGTMTATYFKDPTDRQWLNDPAYQDWLKWMKTFNSNGDLNDAYNVHGYNGAQLLVEVLRRSGDDLSRENIMRSATHIDHLVLPMMIPGIFISTTPEDPRPIKQMKMQRYDGTRWAPFGDVINE